MTLDPIAVVAGATAIGAFLLLIYRSLASGAIHPRNLVPREDYDALLAINADLVRALSNQTKAVQDVGALVERVILKLNGGPP